MTGQYKIAGLTFSLQTVYPYTHRLCENYRSDDEKNFDIVTTERDIAAEKENAPEFNDRYLESLAVYRKLCEKILSDYDGFLFHASAIAVDGNAYLFTAPSGTGKSTHASLWRKVLGERAVMINDDKPIIRKVDGAFYVYGTPWNGKHNLSTNARAKLCGICELTRGEINRIERIAPSADYIRVLMNQSLRGGDGESMLKLLGLFDELLKTVPFYRLACNISEEAARVSYNKMNIKGEKI